MVTSSCYLDGLLLVSELVSSAIGGGFLFLGMAPNDLWWAELGLWSFDVLDILLDEDPSSINGLEPLEVEELLL